MDWWVYYVHMKKMINKEVKTTNLKQALQNRVFISSGSKKSCKGHGCSQGWEGDKNSINRDWDGGKTSSRRRRNTPKT